MTLRQLCAILSHVYSVGGAGTVGSRGTRSAASRISGRAGLDAGRSGEAQLDLSKSYLSRLEDGERQPSIAALLSLAEAFDLTLAALLSEPELAGANCAIVRAGAAPSRQGNGLRYTSLSSREGAAGMHPILVTVPAGRLGAEQYRHEGEEWLYVLSGTLRLSLAEDTHDLAPGDAAHFDARVPHRLAALGGQDVRLILVACTAPKDLLGSYL